MFQVIARTDTEVTAIFLKDSPMPGYIARWTPAEYRQIGVNVSEFIQLDDSVTVYVDGSHVPVRPAAAKCHVFQGGWNGFCFYLDSKGVMYAVKNAR